MRNELKFDDFISALMSAGWANLGDAQHTQARELWENWFPLSVQIEKLRNVVEDAEKLAHDAPELNMSNYDDGQVDELNGKMIELYGLLHGAVLRPNQ